ncbi:MAG: SpvB/TcaC N-terminal domain-containing protein [Candidatus Thiodiazotropha sp.]
MDSLNKDGRGQQTGSSTAKQQSGSSPPASQAPSISLPKGGGAIRGIGEKFAANPVTGTGSITVPIATSPGRSGFGPELALSYDSGAGNGPFGLGWSLNLPSITRKTDKGLPRYLDAEQSDVFLLSNAEDLVPVLNPDGSRFEDGSSFADYTIHRYRPRVEGLFARIERWTRKVDGDVHWRSLSKDNTLTIYGKDSTSRIADPQDPGRVFSWLVCESRDDKGNGILYDYKAEDGAGVDSSDVHERNRGDPGDPRRTSNRYLKHIRYCNRVSLLDAGGQRPRFLTQTQIQNAGWMFEVVFDYGEHDADAPSPDDSAEWTLREDSFSSYRSGFEVRTTRLCRRALMFHHFPGEEGVGDNCLTRSTDFGYSGSHDPGDPGSPVHSTLETAIQSAYKRDGDAAYLKSSMPPVQFEYTKAVVQDEVEEVDAASLENLPVGLDGKSFLWADLHGEGIPGVLAEQHGTWYYKRNLSPLSPGSVDFAPLETVSAKPNLSLSGGARLLDLAGDGQLDLVALDTTTPGFYEHDEDEGWQVFRAFESRLNRDSRDPNLRFIDLDGDGHADVLITEDNAFLWHASLAEKGFAPARRVVQALDEEQGPRIVFADAAQSIYLADFCGDGLTDLVRIRNGEVCYWPNLGHGRFDAKIMMQNSPVFDQPDQFDQQRIRLADIDGTGMVDIIYLHRDGARLYFNRSGNAWSEPQVLSAFARVNSLVNVVATDLLGNGTACLVWSSPLSADTGRPMRYVNLMGDHKPHLLIRTFNNLGAETRVHYAPSTRFYLQDKYDGRPWVTRLPFVVHVVERVETYDHISRNRFVTRYAYHHGYFDGEEREFRGFGMVEQWDTDEYEALNVDDAAAEATNCDAASHVPPILTKTWFHTGIYFGRHHVSDYHAGLLDELDTGEYYRETGLTDAQARQLLLADTQLPDGLSAEEEREACRSLKGTMLRQEVYALDGSEKEPHPFTVVEHTFTVRQLQPQGGNRHAVFFSHRREELSYQYDRNPADPRVSHTLTLEADDFGNVLKSVNLSYGRRSGLSPLTGNDKEVQETTLAVYNSHRFTNSVSTAGDYHAPLPSELESYELTGLRPATDRSRFPFDEILTSCLAAAPIEYQETPTTGVEQKRLIEHVRTLYRPNDCGVSLNDPLALLPRDGLESRALPGVTYKLAFTAALARQTYVDSGKFSQAELDAALAGSGKYVHSEGDENWWIPSGRTFFSANVSDTAAAELAQALRHFFMPRRYRDAVHSSAFSTESFIEYDNHGYFIRQTRDALNNVIQARYDYRVLQPRQIIDPNDNRSEVTFDVMGMVVGTALMGKSTEILGDSFDDFDTDLTLQQTTDFLQSADPNAMSATLLGSATTRIVYDIGRFQRTYDANPDDPGQWKPSLAATIVRETHVSDLGTGQHSKIQTSFSYSDGFGREIQSKIQAEPGKVPRRDSQGRIIVGPDGQPELTANDVAPRWVGSGWAVFNNKGQQIRQFEAFFTDTHDSELDVLIGVSPTIFYDAVGRVVATLHPNHSFEKVVFDSWRHESWDLNDTILIADPRLDADVGHFFECLSEEEYLPSWNERRKLGAMGPQEQAAALGTEMHSATPIVKHMDALGRTFLTVGHNKFDRDKADGTIELVEEHYTTRIVHDIEGNQREVVDANDRIVMRHGYDMLSNEIYQASMDAAERWMLDNVLAKRIFAWDSRGHVFRSEYDPLHRPTRSFVTGDVSVPAGQEILTERLVYGEQHPQDRQLNLRNRLFLQFDQAGLLSDETYDFKGNLTRSSRRLSREYKRSTDWSVAEAALPADTTTTIDLVALNSALAPHLDSEVFESSSTFDARNRPIEIVAPHSASMLRNTIRPSYNEANLLQGVQANLQDRQQAGVPVWTPFVTNIDYDAKGQRTLIEYGNEATTTYEYDRLTFRLMHMLTRRKQVEFAEDCPEPALPGWPGCQIQNLRYTYDPVGNVTNIRDDAQQQIFFRNQRIESNNDYVYDAIYRLVSATGREHLGQLGGIRSPPSAPGAMNSFHTRLAHPGDGMAMGRYLEKYVYDAVGNILAMQHRGTDPNHPGWTRAYTYDQASLLEPAKFNNRLSETQIGATTRTYQYAGGAGQQGNIMAMPHLPSMQWDFRDQLRASARQVTNDGSIPETTWYVYDAGGQRVRKITDRRAQPGQTPTRLKERIYLNGFEVYRQYNNNGVNVNLERETLHITDDQRRLAIVETLTRDTATTDPLPIELIRYQLGNHLGSVSLELDQQAQLISYEEYTPFGSSSYQAVRSLTIPDKRYRFSAKERDEESGLNYHGARYYIVWLGRWLSADPIGLKDGPNVYSYVSNNPIMQVDPDGTNGRPVPQDYAHFEEFADAADEYAQANLPRADLRQEWDRALASEASARQAVRDETATARSAVAQQYQRDLQQLRNIRTPALAFIMPAHVRPYLRDQTVGIRDPYLRWIAGINQRGGLAIATFTNRLAAATLITWGAIMAVAYGEATAVVAGGGISGSALLAGGARLASAYRATSLFITANYARIVAAMTAGGAASRSPVVRSMVQNVWRLNPFQRGRAIEAALVRILPGNAMRASNFPTIDMWVRGANNLATRITSIKSINLAAQSYLRGNAVFNRISQYLTSLGNFAGGRWGGDLVRVSANTVRVLEVAIPPNVATPAQLAQLQRAAQLAQQMGITLNIRVVQ